jgi:hypothetical protein
LAQYEEIGSRVSPLIRPRRDPKKSSAKKRDSANPSNAPSKPKPGTRQRSKGGPVDPGLAAKALREITDRVNLSEVRNFVPLEANGPDFRRDRAQGANENPIPRQRRASYQRQDSLSSQRQMSDHDEQRNPRWLGDEPSEDEIDEQRDDLDIWTAEALTEYINDYYTFKKIFVDVGGYVIPAEQDCDFQYIRDVVAGRKSVLPPGTEISHGPPKSKSINIKKLFDETSVLTPFRHYIKLYPENSYPKNGGSGQF